MRSRPAVAGFTLIELLIAAAILAVLAAVAMPLAELAVKRTKENELRAALRNIRGAIDAYKRAVDEGRVLKKADETGYPPNLDVLEKGIEDARSPDKKRIYFLRRLPRDPMYRDATVAAAETWGKRSYESPPDDPREGRDVYDVYSLSQGVGLNGVPYREW